MNTQRKDRRGYATRVINTVSSTQLLRVVVLSVLEASDGVGAYGYEALKVIKSMVGEDEEEVIESGVWTPSHGSLYKTLREMKDEGLIEEVVKPYVGNRKFYLMTSKGKAELDNIIGPFLGNLKATADLFENMTKVLVDLNKIDINYNEIEPKFTERVDPRRSKLDRSKLDKIKNDELKKFNSSIADM